MEMSVWLILKIFLFCRKFEPRDSYKNNSYNNIVFTVSSDPVNIIGLSIYIWNTKPDYIPE